jgi:hypothetical protein
MVEVVADVAPVGRAGATPVATGVVDPVVTITRLVEIEVEVDPGDKAHEFCEAQTRSAGQHPPPKVTGQAWKFEEQGRVVCRPV